nr:RluA family pseudouridine synthase [uncultured Anaeromusa sp.]
MTEDNTTQLWMVEPKEAGFRLDVFLTERLEQASRSHVQKALTAGAATVNGQSAKANLKLKAGQEVCWCEPQPEASSLQPEALPLDIIYEDAHVAVINKARGMVVHPAAGNHHGTLVHALLEHCKDLSGINGEVRPGIVHRLDKDTTGLLVIAKEDAAHLSLAKQIKEKTATRKYLAIVHGAVTVEQGIVKAPIGRHPKDRKKMAVTFENSKEAVTHFKVLERFTEYTLLECRLETGRTHQIRVHMQYIGHPVVGDPKYGRLKPYFSHLIQGQALHSAQLSFTHPHTKEDLSFEAPLPQDMQSILQELREQFAIGGVE